LFFLETSKHNTHGINLPHGGSGIVADAVQSNTAVKPVINCGNCEGVIEQTSKRTASVISYTTAVPSDCAISELHGNAGVSFTEVVTVTKKSKSQAGGSTNKKVLRSSGRNKSKAGVSIMTDVPSHGHGTAPPSDLHGNAGVSFTEVMPTVKKRRNMEAGAGKDTINVTFKGETPPTKSHGNAGVSFTEVMPTVKNRRNMEAVQPFSGNQTINVTVSDASACSKPHDIIMPGAKESTVPLIESHDAPGIVPHEVQQLTGNQTINVTVSDTSAQSEPHDIMMPGAKESMSLAGSSKRDDLSKHVLNSFYKDRPMFLVGKKHGCIRCSELVTYGHLSSKHVVACASKNPTLVNDYEESKCQ